MKEFTHVVQDPIGVHARPAGQLVKIVTDSRSKVTLLANGGTADAKRLLAVMRLAIKHGMEMTFRVEGEDEEQTAEKLQRFLTANM